MTIKKIRLQLTNFFGSLKPFNKERKRLSSRSAWWIGLFIVIVAIFSYLTNPFMKFSIVNTETNRIALQSNQFILETTNPPILRDNAFSTQLAVIKHGWHFVSNKFSGGKKTPVSSVDEIIREIHRLRFDPELAFLISGDHFSMFYPRSLGIFYHSLLDSRTALDTTDWYNRQLIYAKSLVYALEVYGQSDRMTTTIVPIGPKSVALANFFAYPSDSLYSVLYALSALESDQVHQKYSFENNPEIQLQTNSLSQSLLEQYRPMLRRQFDSYIEFVVDPDTKLIRKDIELSSTKDSNVRQSSLYDNVILWRTYQLAMDLEIIEDDQQKIDDLKQRVLDTFWLEEEGYFLDHLSPDSVTQKYYSSDWLIVYMSGMLDPSIPEEREYLERATAYIQRNALNRPFALAYQPDLRKEELHLIPRLFAPTYASISIWSNWGMEYTKLMISLAQETGDITYLQEAEHQIEAYSYNIRRYRGYPEVYNFEGDFFRQPLYQSIRRTGWVVSFEQAREMLEWTKLNWESFTE